MTGGRSGGFACGAWKRRRRLGWPWCFDAVFVFSWDVPGQSRQPAQVQVIMLGTWYDNFLDGRGAPQPALHGGKRHASHRASALTWLPNGFPQATHFFVVQVATRPARHDASMVFFMVVRPRRATVGTRWECTGLTPGVSCGSVVDRLSTLTARLHCTDGTSPARHDLHMVLFAFWTRTSTTCTWRKRTCFAPSVCGSSVVEGVVHTDCRASLHRRHKSS